MSINITETAHAEDFLEDLSRLVETYLDRGLDEAQVIEYMVIFAHGMVDDDDDDDEVVE